MKRMMAGCIGLIAFYVCLVPSTQAQQSLDFADRKFATLWKSTDATVATHSSETSWLWGPYPKSQGLREAYAQSPSGTRLVQYFDKTRMEINDSGVNRDAAWYVTTGLLPVELITGRLQVGDRQWEQREPAHVAAVGDLTNAFPLYSDLSTIFMRQGVGTRIGEPVTLAFEYDNTVDVYDAYRNDLLTHVAVIENQYGIPAAFLTYMIQRSKPLEQQFVFGSPMSDAYWVSVMVNGRKQPVLFQVFERRILTYTPENISEFRVESGNVGQHYLEWRYPIPSLDISPSTGVLGSLFTVHVYGLAAGEQATVILSPPPYGGGGFAPATIVGDAQATTFQIRTTSETTPGSWGVSVTRDTISPFLIGYDRFDITAP